MKEGIQLACLCRISASYYIITARKRSLGQGNIFTSVCQEFCSQGGCLLLGGCLLPGGACSWRVPAPGGVWSQGVPAPGGGLFQGGVPAPGGGLVKTPRMASVAGGTHPAGMHSCYFNDYQVGKDA